MGSITGYNSNQLNGNDFTILQLNVEAPTPNSITTIPSALISNEPYLESNVNATRSLLFQPAQMGPSGMLNGPFEINGQVFDMEVINYEIPLNNIEIWELTNQTAISHPFHIHDVQFYILDINGNPPPVNMQGRKDVVLVPPMLGTVRFITKFEDFADEDTPYMYHCHMLSHEDDGMMGQFIVYDNSTGIEEQGESRVSIYPNPTLNIVRIHKLSPSTIALYNTSGQLLEIRESAADSEQFNLTEYAAGVYYFNIITRDQSCTYKVVKN
jgi:Multicopper oxidase/Secretion system C-terminal sorting domain